MRLVPPSPLVAPLVALLAAAAACAAVPAAASAGTMTQEGTVLVYTAAAGETNQTRLLSQGTSAIDVAEQLTALRVTSRTPACTPTFPDGRVRCSLTGISRIDVRLGDRNDSFGSFHGFPVVLEGGTGDDTYVALATRGSSQVDFRGGSGRDEATWGAALNGVIVDKDERALDGRVIDGRIADRDNIRGDVEVLRGSSDGDFLAGGAGPETFHSTDGADTLAGRDGNDVFLMGVREDGRTTVVGGPGRDTTSYAERDDPLVISADDAATGDGERDEGDHVTESEVIEGGRFTNTITTPPLSTQGYHLFGGPHDDVLTTGAGEDGIVGGAGFDVLRSGPRRDGIVSRDAVTREIVDCGSNGSDIAEVNGDRTTGCEVVRQPGQVIGVLGLTPAEAVARAGAPARLDVGWRHPVSWRRLRSVTVHVTESGRHVGRLAVHLRDDRVTASGAVRLAGRHPRLTRDGRMARARLAVRVAPRFAGRRLGLDVVATDSRGRRQVEREAGALRVLR